MSDTYRIQISPAAADDLESIFAYISGDSPRRAQQVMRRVLFAIDSLETMPERCAVVGGSDSAGLRSVVVRPFLIRFRIDPSAHLVRIVQVRHGARNA